MKSIKELQQEIVKEFSDFDDWTLKYSYLIELGNELPTFNEKLRLEKYLIRGCQSRVWLYAEKIENRILFHADSDALIVKGIIAILLRVFSGRTSKEIIDSNTNFITEIGLDKHLSPTRSNGLLAMVKQMKFYAIALLKK